MLMDAPRTAEGEPCGPDATDAESAARGWNALARLAASRIEAFVACAAYFARAAACRRRR